MRAILLRGSAPRSGSIGTAIASLDGRWLHVNPALCRFLGYSEEELLKLRCVDVTLPDDLWATAEARQRLLQGDIRAYQFEKRYSHKSGRPLWAFVNASLMRDSTGRPQSFALQIVDITERKRAEDAQHESEERFRTLFENATVGIYRTTPDGRVLMANPMLIRMLGFVTFEELAKRNLEEEGFEPQYSRAMFRKQIEQQGVIKELEAAWRKHDGSLAFIRESARAIRDDDGRVMYYDGIVEDISERKRAEEALHRTQRELRALAARLLSNEEEEHRSLARELHDDFNQRLAALGFDLVDLEASCPANAPPILTEKLRAVQSRLANLSDDLRGLAHQLHPSAIELLGLPVALRELCQDASKRGGFAVSVRARSCPESLSPSAALCLYRVAQECLRNIAKHAKSAKVTVTLSAVKQGLRLTIKDNGVGFNPAAVPPKGGLGLISIRERVRLAGGTLSMKSRPGQGTQVTVEVPAAGVPKSASDLAV
jgi:PAS domain S-box-containing protein